MDKSIGNNNLDDTFSYLDNITICGTDQNDHDINLIRFMEGAERKNLKFNRDKCTFSGRKIQLLAGTASGISN